MTARPATPPSAAPTRRDDARLWETLPGLLDRMIEAHRHWLDALEAHKRAIGKADVEAIGAAIERERDHAGAVEHLEGERRALLEVRPGADSPTITELARTRGEPERAALLAKGDELRALIVRVRREQAVVKQASSSVLSHMRGLMHSITSRVSHAGTYGAGGRVSAGPVVVSGLDIRQ